MQIQIIHICTDINNLERKLKENNEQFKDSGTIGYFSPLRLNIIVIISILLFVYTES